MSESPLRLMVVDTLRHATLLTGGKVRFDMFARKSLTHPKAWDDFNRHVNKGEILTCNGLVWLPENQNTPYLTSEAMWVELTSRWTAIPIEPTVRGFFHREGPGCAMDPNIALTAFGQYVGMSKVDVCHAVAKEIAISPSNPVSDPLGVATLNLTKMFGMTVSNISTDYQSIINFAVVAYRNARSEVIRQTIASIGTQREQLCKELETLK